jgi:aspartate/methionine/tyrosine aminotransferase
MTESVIREMTRYSREVGAINLAQGFPDFPPAAAVTKAAREALAGDFNQYSITWGASQLREAIAEYYRHWYELDVHPDRHVTVCCGSTEAMLSTVLATVNPDERIVIFEPYYENYLPDTILSGAEPVFIRLVNNGNQWEIPWEKLEKSCQSNFSAMIINTPNNPTGKVYSKDELARLGELCKKHNALLISDEIYEHILFDGEVHTPPATLEGMWQNTVTINSLSKTFAVTGWRVGWAIAPEKITNAIRKVHDFTTVGAPHPLQVAGAEMLTMDDLYFKRLADFYQSRRDFLAEGLTQAGFEPMIPDGAYYMLAKYPDSAEIGSDIDFCYLMAKRAGVATVPGSSFFSSIVSKTGMVRFCFGKRMETLEEVVQRLHSADLR